jgi:hypothetical protein
MSVGNRFALVLGLLMSASCSSPNPSYIGNEDLKGSAHDLSVIGGPPAPDLSSHEDLSVEDLATHHHDLSGEDLHHAHEDLSHQEDLAKTPPDLGGTHQCIMPGGSCIGGVSCGGGCCASGEWCDNGSCRCGNGPACTGGNLCAGVTLGGGLACGTTCCGAIGSLCPL